MRKIQKKLNVLIVFIVGVCGNGIPVSAFTDQVVSSVTVSGPLNLSKTYKDKGASTDRYYYDITAKTIESSGGGGWSSTATGLVTGGQAYTELRASGTYIGASTRTNANVTALDTALAKVGNEEIVASTDNDSISIDSEDTTDSDNVKTTTYKLKAKEANLVSGDTGLVTGDDAYDELRSGADGTRISSTSTTAANLTALDKQAKLNADQIEINEKDIQDLRDMKNLTEDGKTYIKNLAKEGVKVKSGNESILSVTKTDVGGIDTYSITAKTGEIEQGVTTLVTGGKVYEQVHISADGNYIKQSNTTAQNLSALDTQVKSNSDLIIDLDNRVGNKIQGLFEDLSQVAASAAALSALRPEGYDPDDRWSFAVGYGHYKNRNAGAVGVFFKPDLDVTFSVGSTVWSGDPMMNVGASFRRKRTAGAYRTAQELTYRIRALEADETKRKETLATQIKRIEKAENTSFLLSHRITHLETVNQKLKESNAAQKALNQQREKEIAEIKADNEYMQAAKNQLKQQIEMLRTKMKEAEKAKEAAAKMKKQAAAKVAAKTEVKVVAKSDPEKGKKVETKTVATADVKPVSKNESKTVAKNDVKPMVKTDEKKVSKLARIIMRRKAQLKAKAEKKEEESGKKELAPVSAKSEAKAVAKIEMAKDAMKSVTK